MPRPNAWPYRDYVIGTFNRDTPFPRFVLEQLAGDTLADATGLTAAATGFLVGGTHDIVGNQTIEGMRQQRVDDLDDIITATGTAFLGLTVNCGRCHDHKFDPITQRDYYGLQAVFAGVAHGSTVDHRGRLGRPPGRGGTGFRRTGPGRASPRRVRASRPGRTPMRPSAPWSIPGGMSIGFAPVAARMARMTILATSNQSEPCIDEFEVFTAGETPRNVALDSSGGKASASSEYPGAAIHKIAHLNDGQAGNSHSWISQVPGKGTLTIEWPQAATIDRIVWSRDREGSSPTGWRPSTTWKWLSSPASGTWSPRQWIVFRSGPRVANGSAEPGGPDLGAGRPAGRAAERCRQPAGTAGRAGDHDLGLRRNIQPARANPRPPQGRPDAAAGRGPSLGDRGGAATAGAAGQRLRE